MAAIVWEKEIHKAYEQEVDSITVAGEVWIRFTPGDVSGVQLDVAVKDPEKVDEFSAPVKRGLEAGMAFFGLPGVKATWIDVLLGSQDACDLVVSWTAALALREAVSASDLELGPADDRDWLRAVGLYSEDTLHSYHREKVEREFPWLNKLNSLPEDAPKSERLRIWREAAATGDLLAILTLKDETDDSRERFEMTKTYALVTDALSALADACEQYGRGAGDRMDPDAIELHIKLGHAYKSDNGMTDADWAQKMSDAYEKAWECAVAQGVSGESFMQMFAQSVADTMMECGRSNAAVTWLRRIDSAGPTIRTELALLDGSTEERLHLAECYADGIAPFARDDELAGRLYSLAQYTTVLSLRQRMRAGEKIELKTDPTLVKINEKLGDLYAREDSPLYSLEKAYDCYMAAAAVSDSAKKKVLAIMRRKKELENQGQ